jgi:hypothetical protein
MRLNFFIFFGLMFLIACSNNKNPYQNNLGIEQSLLAQMDTAHYTLIKWKDTLDNFGTINKGDSVHLEYMFTNVGHTPLFIINTRTSCGCTITNFPKEAVMPGKYGVIKITYKNGAEIGEINKSIIVVANTKKSMNSNLIIRGIVKPVNKNQ